MTPPQTRATHRANVPVIVGVGDLAQRSTAELPLDPVSLASEACRLAAEDCGAPPILSDADSVDLVNVVAWSYDDAAGRLVEALGATPSRREHSEVGGHQPTRLVDAAAARIAGGSSRVAVVAGAETMRSLQAAMRAGERPPWPPPPADAAPVNPRDHVGPQMAALDLIMPTDVYPLYEQGSRAAAGMNQAQARREAAVRWSAASHVAAQNPAAWHREPVSVEHIETITDHNRLVTWPYPKLMNARLDVDQGAAAIITSVEVATRWRIPKDRWIFPFGGSGASEADEVFYRPSFARTDAGAAALDGALGLHDLDIGDVDLLELYSCFPCVPRMASRHLGLDVGATTTVTGGLTFFGGPGNDYMLHAVAAMVRALRAGRGTRGLLYGQGGYVTKHHAMVLGIEPTDGYVVDDRERRQKTVDAVESPTFRPGYQGAGVIETFTIPFDRDGLPIRAVVIGRSPEGHRFAGVLDPEPGAIRVLTDLENEPIGHAVRATAADGMTTIELA